MLSSCLKFENFSDIFVYHGDEAADKCLIRPGDSKCNDSGIIENPGDGHKFYNITSKIISVNIVYTF